MKQRSLVVAKGGSGIEATTNLLSAAPLSSTTTTSGGSNNNNKFIKVMVRFRPPNRQEKEYDHRLHHQHNPQQPSSSSSNKKHRLETSTEIVSERTVAFHSSNNNSKGVVTHNSSNHSALEDNYSSSSAGTDENHGSNNNNNNNNKQYFSFDHVLDPKVTQEEVHDHVGKPCVESVLQGYNGTVLAYGQTGAGKTHSMLGPRGGAETTEELLKLQQGGGAASESQGSSTAAAPLGDGLSTKGLLPRMVEQLFQSLSSAASVAQGTESSSREVIRSITSWSVKVSVFELYQDKIQDLMVVTPPKSGGKNSTKTNIPHQSTSLEYKIRRDDAVGGRGIFVENLIRQDCHSAQETLVAIAKALSHRRTHATGSNDTSSRSHCITEILVEQQVKEEVVAATAQSGGHHHHHNSASASNNNNKSCSSTSLIKSKLTIVDLAGSEKAKKTGASGERLEEAGKINKSLSALGNVINILASNKSTNSFVSVNGSGKHHHQRKPFGQRAPNHQQGGGFGAGKVKVSVSRSTQQEPSTAGHMDAAPAKVYVPYRSNKLTELLEEALGGNACTTLLCHATLARFNADETLSTLQFAQRAKEVENKPIVNKQRTREELEDALLVAQDEIKHLKEELKSAIQKQQANHHHHHQSSDHQLLSRPSVTPSRGIMLGRKSSMIAGTGSTTTAAVLSPGASASKSQLCSKSELVHVKAENETLKAKLQVALEENETLRQQKQRRSGVKRHSGGSGRLSNTASTLRVSGVLGEDNFDEEDYDGEADGGVGFGRNSTNEKAYRMSKALRLSQGAGPTPIKTRRSKRGRESIEDEEEGAQHHQEEELKSESDDNSFDFTPSAEKRHRDRVAGLYREHQENMDAMYAKIGESKTLEEAGHRRLATGGRYADDPGDADLFFEQQKNIFASVISPAPKSGGGRRSRDDRRVEGRSSILDSVLNKRY